MIEQVHYHCDANDTLLYNNQHDPSRMTTHPARNRFQVNSQGYNWWMILNRHKLTHNVPVLVLLSHFRSVRHGRFVLHSHTVLQILQLGAIMHGEWS
jgi:hypothetical protein